MSNKSTTTKQSSEPQRSFFARYRRVLLVVGIWVLLIMGIQIYTRQQQLMPFAAIQQLVMLFQDSSFGPLLFISAAALSPFFLLPAALFGSVAGLAFGPVLGVMYTLIGCNLSATLTYLLGRYSSHDMAASGPISRLLDRYGERLHDNALLTVIVLRLTFLPYDPVNYMLGIAQITWLRFIIANTIGSLPGVIAIVLIGASLTSLDSNMPMLNPLLLLPSAGLLIVSLGVAFLLKRRAAHSA